MSADFTWWRKALQGSFDPLHENDPQPGYWRMKPRRGDPGAPVAIWREADGTLQALRAGQPADPFAVWTWCCCHPVSEELYRHVAEQGGRWPDEPDSMLPGLGHNSGRRRRPYHGQDGWTEVGSTPRPRDPGSPADAGGGSGPADPDRHASAPPTPAPSDRDLDGAASLGLAHSDALAGLMALAQAVTIPVEAAREQPGARQAELLRHTTKLWDDACLWLTRIEEVRTQEQADKAANYAHLFALMERAAEEARTTEKAPALRQGRLVDARWRPVLDAAGRAKTRMKQAVEPFLLARLEALRAPAGLDAVAEKDWPRAGTLDRRVGLRRDRRLAIIDKASVQAAYREDARLWATPAVETALARLAETDLAEGRAVPGALLVEHLSAV